MKRVLVLNADSFVGIQVCRRFFEKKEYLIDGTLYHHSNQGKKTQVTHDETQYSGSYSTKNKNTTDVITTPTANASYSFDPLVPEDMSSFLNSVMPRHGEISDEQFRVRVLTYDIIIAVLEEDAFEADCTIKILLGTHYEVEKTFVLVSNVFTWTRSDAHERELQRAERRAARLAELANNDIDSETGATDDVEEEEEEEEEEIELKVWTEEDYHKRYPDSRYHAWKELEHTVKHANSETLHTYVLWAGLPYGGGEDLLQPYFHAAWLHDKMLQYGDGLNYIPTIHVKDLSRIIYLVGSSYDTLEERYMFAVDQGNNTQADILQGIKDFIGGIIETTTPLIDYDNQSSNDIKENHVEGTEEEINNERRMIVDIRRRERALQMNLEPWRQELIEDGESEDSEGSIPVHIEGLAVNPPHGLGNWLSAINVKCEPGAVLSLLEESDWVSLGGFFANVDKVVKEFKKERMLRPMRLILSGPPLSMTGDVAATLAELFHIPHLTLGRVISSYEEHVANVRSELVEILLRRRARRQAARDERIRREEERLKREKAAAAEEEEEEEEGEEGVEGEEEEENEEAAAAGAGGTEDSDEEGSKNGVKGVDGPTSTAVDADNNIAFATIAESELLEPPEDEEDEEEEDNRSDEERDEKAAAIAQQVDRTERRRIETLREEYRFATKLLSLHLLNGEFPKRRSDEDEEEEEEEDDDYDNNERRKHRREKEAAAAAAAAAAATAPPPIRRYLDEALAVMVRWRLRQDDCRSQGYILECFPETVRQAWLTFLADTEEQKEMQRPKLEREREEEADPQLPQDAQFPLPVLDDLEDVQQKEMLDAMEGKTFLTAEEALNPTNDVFFPDCFISLTCSENVLQAQMTALRENCGIPLSVIGGGTNFDDTSGGTPGPKEFYEKLTRYMKHNRPNAPPTESLISWFQTVTVEKVEDDIGGGGGGGGGDENDGNGDEDEKPPRTACVLLIPALPNVPTASPIPTSAVNSGPVSSTGPISTTASVPSIPLSHDELSAKDTSRLDAYCDAIRWRILKAIGYGCCGETMAAACAAEEDSRVRQWREFESEAAVLDRLYAAEDDIASATIAEEAAILAEETRALRYYQAREEYAAVAGVERIPADVYLMRYVMPSLTPLLADVVRLRPEDPVAALADALFHHKRQTTL